MEITIANVGPIRSASVRLAPLTVLVGPNNSGKSIVLTVLYSVLGQFGAYLPFQMTRPSGPRPLNLSEEETSELQEELVLWNSRVRKPELEELSSQARAFLERNTEQAILAYSELLVQQLARSAGAELEDLRRANKGKSVSVVAVSSDTPKWKVAIRLNASGPRSEVAQPSFEDVWESLDRESWKRYRTRVRRMSRNSPTQALSDLGVELTRTCFREFPKHTRYMPAARSGLMQSHKALSGSLIRRAAYAGIREMQIPAVSGIIADFLGEMIEIGPRSDGHFAEHAHGLERDILNGAIELVEDPSGGYPEPTYRSAAGAFPLGRTSSMVSELAPVVLYLRHLMQRGDLLMIEEPEAHLHPQAQVAFAKAIVRLVNAGLRVAMTTHSEFFLQQLNNAVIAARLNGTNTDDIDLDPQTRIAAKDVAAYIFRPEGESGTQVLALEVDQRDGIPEGSFSDVAEYLYDQNVALDKKVTDEPEA